MQRPFALLPDELRHRLGQRAFIRRQREIGVLLFRLLVLRGHLGPALIDQLFDRREVLRLAVERDFFQLDADHAGIAAADEHAVLFDRRRAFHVDEFADDRVLPDGPAVLRAHAIERRAIRLVHAVAEDDEPAEDRRRRNRGQREKRRAFRPKHPLRRVGIDRECVEGRRAEAAERGDVQRAEIRHERGDEMLRGLVNPEDVRLLRPGLAVDVAGALEVAAVGGPIGGRRGVAKRDGEQRAWPRAAGVAHASFGPCGSARIRVTRFLRRHALTGDSDSHRSGVCPLGRTARRLRMTAARLLPAGASRSRP